MATLFWFAFTFLFPFYWTEFIWTQISKCNSYLNAMRIEHKGKGSTQYFYLWQRKIHTIFSTLVVFYTSCSLFFLYFRGFTLNAVWRIYSRLIYYIKSFCSEKRCWENGVESVDLSYVAAFGTHIRYHICCAIVKVDYTLRSEHIPKCLQERPLSITVIIIIIRSSFIQPVVKCTSDTRISIKEININLFPKFSLLPHRFSHLFENISVNKQFTHIKGLCCSWKTIKSGHSLR